MAKTKAARKKPAAVTLRFISDPGHGWAEVPAALCKKLGLGTDFAERGRFFYLEEDEEATRLDRALKRHGVKATFVGHEVDDFDNWVAGPQWPYIPAAVYGDERLTVIAALESLAMEMKQTCMDDTRPAGERAMWRQRWEECERLALMFSTMTGEK